MMKRKLVIPVLVLIVLAVGFFMLSHSPRAANNKQTPTNSNQTASSISMIATGDWIAHDSVNAAAKQANGSYNYLPLVSDFKPIFAKADIRFCNDPILNGGSALGISGYPKFNSPAGFVSSMAALGCNLVNVASNHSFDFSQQNIDNSLAAWNKQSNMLAVNGENSSQAQQDQLRIFTVKGVKMAFLAYTTYINTDDKVTNNYGVNVFSDSLAAKQIQAAKQAGAQFIIASMRWGTEYSNTLTSEEQTDAQWLADHDVNLVLGHGTHVLQPVQWLSGKTGNKTLVWYGLGDFLHSQIPADTVFNGIAAMQINPKTLAITRVGFLPIYMHYEWSAPQAQAQDLSARHNLHLYLAEDATQSMINSQQLATTVAAQEQRMNSTLETLGSKVPLITTQKYLNENY